MSEDTESRTGESAKEEAARQQPEPTRTTAEGDPPEVSKTEPNAISGDEQNPGQTQSPAPEDDVGT